jgi:hypothetical protein
MPAAYSDIRNEIADLAEEVERLGTSLARHPDLAGLDQLEVWERTHFLASATEKVYTGCERVMSRIASDVDHEPIARGDGWHIGLLKRMSHPIADVRDAVIGPDLYSKLDRLRSFRHRERNSYGLQLDSCIVLERAKEAVIAFDVFRIDVERFLDLLSAKPDEAQDDPSTPHN